MRRLLTEPFVLFVLLGAVLYAALSLAASRPEPEDLAIVVPAGQIRHLADLFSRTWQRPPTPGELESLVDSFVREEAAYRQGLALGLDRDDVAIRRRVRQKLDFVAAGIAVQREPTDADLAAYLAAHPDDYRVDPRLSFRHVYINPDRHGASLEADLRDLLTTLNADPAIDAGALGDRILLDHGYPDTSTRDVARLFGADFAAAVAELEPGAWHGPIPSGYGLHLVRVDERAADRLPALAEVRDAVRRDWENTRRTEAIERFYRELLARVNGGHQSG